jgi:imidazolonepropionase-like amidohydrolase
MNRLGTMLPLLVASIAMAQSEMPAAAPQEAPIAIVNARIDQAVSGTAPIARGHVVFDKGVIVSVGAGDPASLPANCQTVDGAGLTVLPGFVNTGSTLGLVETLQVQATDDRTEFGAWRPEVRACVAVNPDSNLIPVARAGGVLTSCLFPQGGVVSGHASVMRLDGWTSEDQTISPRAGLLVNWPVAEPITAPWMDKSVEDQKRDAQKNMKEIDRFFDQAKAWADAHEADPKGTPGDLRFQNMVEVVRGREPVILTANSPGSIESAVLWAVRRGLKPVIWGGMGADQCVPLLKKHGVPVLIAGTHRLPRRSAGAIDDVYRLPSRLYAEGIPFAIATGSDPSNERHLPDHAATAVAYGLPPDAALRSITRDPAMIMGVAGKLGSIEAGKAATLQLVSGTPLEMTCEPLVAFIDGRRVDLGNHQTRLDAKYREKYRRMGKLPPVAKAAP